MQPAKNINPATRSRNSFPVYYINICMSAQILICGKKENTATAVFPKSNSLFALTSIDSKRNLTLLHFFVLRGS